VRKSNLYILAAALALSIVPFTVIFMMPTNQRLSARASQADDDAVTLAEKGRETTTSTGALAKADGDAEVHGLLTKWSRMNVARACLLLAAAAVGLFATLF
jgi:hypothetical protein